MAVKTSGSSRATEACPEPATAWAAPKRDTCRVMRVATPRPNVGRHWTVPRWQTWLQELPLPSISVAGEWRAAAAGSGRGMVGLDADKDGVGWPTHRARSQRAPRAELSGGGTPSANRGTRYPDVHGCDTRAVPEERAPCRMCVRPRPDFRNVRLVRHPLPSGDLPDHPQDAGTSDQRRWQSAMKLTDFPGASRVRHRHGSAGGNWRWTDA